MIRLDSITKKYGGQTVLEDFSLEIKKGEHIAVSGKSGAGKTTLIRLILGLIKPDSGRITLPKDLRISAVFQEDRLIEHLSAYGNISVIHQNPPTEEEILGLFDRAQLPRELIYKPVSELSGGERRRVCIARMLSLNADLYILDEAFKGIDRETAEAIICEVKAAAEGKAMVVITHDEWEADRLCDRKVNI